MSSFPIVNEINQYRVDCFNINYDNTSKNVDTLSSFAGWFSHRVLTVLSLPANTAAVAIGITGMGASCLLAALKISVWIFSGHQCGFSTKFWYFADAASESFCHIFRIVYEVAFEYFYRLFNSSEVVYPVEYNNNAPMKTLPGIEYLNSKRVELRAEERSLSPWFKHKGLSAVCIPLNLGALAVCGAGAAVTSVLVIAKVALYVLTGIQIKYPTGCQYLANAAADSAYHIVRNIGEISLDSFLIVGDVANLLGMRGALERARNFAANAFNNFCRAL